MVSGIIRFCYTVKVRIVEMMRNRPGSPVVLALVLWLLTGGVVQAAPQEAQLAAALQQQLAVLGADPTTPVAGDTLHSLSQVSAFYAQRNYRPAWSDASQAASLATSIAEADQQGLDPADYHLAAIRGLLAQPVLSPEMFAQRELLLTDAFLTYARHLAEGRLHPQQLFPNWGLETDPIDGVGLLQQALATNKVAASLAELPPDSIDYRGLCRALARYRRIASHGGWSDVPAGPKLELGVRSQRVWLLRLRLMASGDLPADAKATEVFDSGLERAVRHFQRRLGLKVDGVVGARTLAALNVPLATRIGTIIINLERLRWLPRRFGPRYVRVNIPAFELTAVDRGEPVLQMRAIVGRSRPDNTTPVFTATIRGVALNPVWNIPKSIVDKEMLPRLRQDPGLLARMHILVLQGYGDEARQVDPASIDWANVDADNFPYHLRRESGPDNDLGLLKFLAPNRYDVYLHDTPHKWLFDTSVRNFSHGCVRIEHPLSLAIFALRGDPAWDETQLHEAVDGGKRQVIHLPDPLPLYLLYLTAWADDNGEVHFRNDIYKRDQKLLEALR